MKWFANLTLALLLALALTACGNREPSGASKAAPGSDQEASALMEAPARKEVPAPEAGSKLVFAYRGCPLPMNSEFAPLLDYIGEADSYFEAASCAFDGLDKTYTYGDVEIITYPDGDVDHISSIRLLSDAVATPEGVTIGSSRDEVAAAYGEDCEALGDQYTCEDGDTMLNILFQDDKVISVEYIAVNPLLV